MTWGFRCHARSDEVAQYAASCNRFFYKFPVACSKDLRNLENFYFLVFF